MSPAGNSIVGLSITLRWRTARKLISSSVSIIGITTTESFFITIHRSISIFSGVVNLTDTIVSLFPWLKKLILLFEVQFSHPLNSIV